MLMPENTRIRNEVARMAKSAIFTSFCWIFLPMYSGVRPTMRPAMKTPMMA